VPQILQHGASYERQRAVRDANAGSLTAVVDSLLAEMREGRPLTDLARVPVPAPSPASSA
jgi:carboxylate-amine ligase